MRGNLPVSMERTVKGRLLERNPECLIWPEECVKCDLCIYNGQKLL